MGTRGRGKPDGKTVAPPRDPIGEVTMAVAALKKRITVTEEWIRRTMRGTPGGSFRIAEYNQELADATPSKKR